MQHVMRKDDVVAVVPPARRRDRDLLVGAFVVLGALATVVVLLVATDPSMLRGRYTVKTLVQDVGGMRNGDPVRMRGVNVGHVAGFGLVPGGVELSLQIEKRYRVPADSKVTVAPSSLLGRMAVDIEPGQAEEAVADGGWLEGRRAGPDLTQSMDQVADRASATLERLEALLSDDTVRNVQGGSADLRALLAELRELVGEQGRSLSSLSGSLRRSARGVEQAAAGPELGRIVGRLDAMTERLDAASVALGRSAQSARSILARVEEGEGALGRLTRDDALYVNANRAIATVEQAAAEFAKLAEDVRKNPKRYVNLSLF